MADEKKPILDPERELPEPHDMQLPAGFEGELPPSASKPTKRSFPMWIFPLIAFLIVLLAGGMYFLNMQNTATETVPPTEPTATPTVTPTPDPTANWKTYTNQEYGFSVKYPPDVKIYEKDNFVDIDLVEAPPMSVGAGTSLRIEFIDSEERNLREAHRSYIKYACESENGGVCLDTKFNGLTALKASDYINISEVFSYYVPHEDGIYRISWSPGEEESPYTKVMEEILSTFTFLDTSPTASVSEAMKGCTMDAKVCPDGSTVGRVGPNCEFAACPGE